MVQLTDELLALLDEEAARRGESRSAVVREAVTDYLSGGREAAITRRIVEGYVRVPQATPDEWGDLEAEQDRATAGVLERLDREDERSGLEPW